MVRRDPSELQKVTPFQRRIESVFFAAAKCVSRVSQLSEVASKKLEEQKNMFERLTEAKTANAVLADFVDDVFAAYEADPREVEMHGGVEHLFEADLEDFRTHNVDRKMMKGFLYGLRRLNSDGRNPELKLVDGDSDLVPIEEVKE